MTNREVLARKGNEELAHIIAEIVPYGECSNFCICNYGDDKCMIRFCYECIQQWLEQEAKDDE